MSEDTRSRNTYFKNDNISNYLKEYTGALAYGLNRVDPKALAQASEVLRLTVVRGGRIFVAGNGGSWAIADHLCCDFVKGTTSDKYNNLVVHPLGSPALTTAIANDISYDDIFSKQLEYYQLSQKDIVILISSSGNSKNIIKAVDLCISRDVETIGMTGFNGGKLAEKATYLLHVPVHNYGVVEDAHQSLMHIIAQFHHLAFP